VILVSKVRPVYRGLRVRPEFRVIRDRLARPVFVEVPVFKDVPVSVERLVLMVFRDKQDFKEIRV
jgi:hypothetical protein